MVTTPGPGTKMACDLHHAPFEPSNFGAPAGSLGSVIHLEFPPFCPFGTADVIARLDPPKVGMSLCQSLGFDGNVCDRFLKVRFAFFRVFF